VRTSLQRHYLDLAAPGSVQGLYLVVYDIEAARAELVDRGVEVSEVFHDIGGIFHHAGTEGRYLVPIRNAETMPRLPHSVIRRQRLGAQEVKTGPGR